MSTEITPSLLRSYADRIEQDLLQNILPFWMEKVVNPESQSFHGALSNDNTVDPSAERGALLTARILWTFSAAARRFPGEPAYLQTADFAFTDLFRLYHDSQHGGFYWSVSADGQPLRKRKQVYGQAFCIYALSEFYRVSKNKYALDTAIELFQLLERHAKDPTHGGYREAYARDWSPIADMRLSEIDLNTPKSQNTLLHVMEAYTNLLDVWPDKELRQALSELIHVMLEKVMDPPREHLRLFFSDDWEPVNDTISYGHDIEAAWLLTEAARVLNDNRLSQEVTTASLNIARATQKTAIDQDGALLYEGTPVQGVTRFHKEWWPQNEAIVGFINAFQQSGDRSFLQTSIRLWDFCEKYLIDHQNGEWFRIVSRDYQINPNDLKVSFWKCPYHNGRAGIEAPARLRAIADKL